MNNKEYKLKRMHQYDGKIISDSQYNLIIGLTLLFGLVVNFIMATIFKEFILSLSYLPVVIFYFVGSITGSLITYNSKSSIVSFCGFSLVSLSMGLLLTFFVSYYDVADISTAIFLTLIVVLAMIFISTLKPQIFTGIGKTLFIVCLISLIAEIVLLIITKRNFVIFDFLFVIVFCGYIGYDWVRAQNYPKTIDNAIDSAADLYIDIANIFVRILSILGKKD